MSASEPTPCSARGLGEVRQAALSGAVLAGRPPHWDAKIADFGLHTTVKAAQSRWDVPALSPI